MRQGSPDRVSSLQPTYTTPKQPEPSHNNGQMPTSGAGLTQGMWSPQGYTNAAYTRGTPQQQQYDMYADDRVDEEHKAHSYPPPPPLYNTPYRAALPTHPTPDDSSLYHTSTRASPLTQHPAALLASITHSPYSPPYTPRDTILNGEQSHPLSATGTANDFYWLKQYQLNHALHSSHSSSSGTHYTTSFSTYYSTNQHHIPDLTST